MHPLSCRRKEAEQLRFAKEYDEQDLLHFLAQTLGTKRPSGRVQSDLCREEHMHGLSPAGAR